jgi:hypothetical protein
VCRSFEDRVAEKGHGEETISDLRTEEFFFQFGYELLISPWLRHQMEHASEQTPAELFDNRDRGLHLVAGDLNAAADDGTAIIGLLYVFLINDAHLVR